MAASLISVLVELANALGNGDKLVSELESEKRIESLVEKIAPEFQGDFRNMIECGIGTMPRLEFLVYWEKNKNCQEAVRELLRPMVTACQRLMDAVKAVAEWEP